MRKPRDIDAELKAIRQRQRELKARRTVQFGELVEATGADALPFEALAGVLLTAIDQATEQPEAVARWTERGQAFFRPGTGKDGKRGTAASPASGIAGPRPAPAQIDGACG